MPSVFKKADAQLLEKATSDAEKLGGRKQKEAAAKKAALLEKKRRWVIYAAYVQGLIKLLCYWKGITPKYDGPADGSDWDAFEKDYLAPIYRAMRGKPYGSSRGEDPLDKAVAFLHGLLGGMFSTDDEGVLRIVVPVGERGKITLEMAHLKLLAIDDARKMGDRPVMTAFYGRSGDSFARDLPGSSEEKSCWRLECDKHKAELRNFISFDYDATREDAVTTPARMSTYAMVWCQPTWFEPSSDTVCFEPGTRPTDDRRALVDGRPTLVVSTSVSPQGHWYGSYGDRGRRKSWDWQTVVKELPAGSGKWFALSDRRTDKVRVVYWGATEADIDAGLREEFKNNEEFAYLWSVCTTREIFNSKDYKPGKEPTIHIIGEEKPRKLTKADMDGEYHVVVKWIRDYDGPLSLGDAVLNALEDAIPGQDLLARMPDGRWRLQMPRGSELQEHPEYFDSIEDALDGLKIPKMHHGIDCAGNVGDPVFAAAGGTLMQSGKVVHNSSASAAGLVAAVRTWLPSFVYQIQTLHMQSVNTKAGKPVQVKAGDVIGVMGRTGNPVSESPTHAHFQCGKDLSSCVLHGYEAIFPHNNQPKLLPCGADWWTTPSQNSSSPGQERNDDESSPRKCRAIPAFRGNRKNTVPGSCWAVREGVCPHKMTLREYQDLVAAEKAEEKAAREAARKKNPKEAVREGAAKR
jgi:hypothetical protein